MDINTGADGGISSDINSVSSSIIADVATENTGIAMLTVSIGKKTKKAAVSCSHRLMSTFIKSNSLCRRELRHVPRRPRRTPRNQRSHQALQAHHTNQA